MKLSPPFCFREDNLTLSDNNNDSKTTKVTFMPFKIGYFAAFNIAAIQPIETGRRLLNELYDALRAAASGL